MGKVGVEHVISIANKGYSHLAWGSRAGQNNQECEPPNRRHEPEEEGRRVLSQTKNHMEGTYEEDLPGTGGGYTPKQVALFYKSNS